jgi:hypothetical protein
MTLRIQTRLFAYHADAAAALHDLGVAGFLQDEASLIGSGNDTGVAAGGLVGSLTASGVAEPEAQGLAEGLRHGGTIVVVRTDEARSERAGTILANHLAVTSPEAEDPAILAAPAPGTPGNPPGR